MRQSIQNQLLYIYTLLIISLIFIRVGIGYFFPVQILLLVSIIPSFFVNISQYLALPLMLIPFSSAFQYKYVLLIYIIVGIMRFHHIMKFSKVLIPIFILMFWELFHGINSTFSVNEFFRLFAELLFVGFVACINISECDLRSIFRVFSFSVVGVCMILVYNQIKDGNGLLEIFSQNVDSYRFGMADKNEFVKSYRLVFNPNELGFICCLSVVGILSIMMCGKYTFFDVLLMSLSILFGLFTLSRSFLVCLIFVVTLYLISRKKQYRNNNRIIPLILLFGCVVIVLTNFFPSLIDGFSQRNETTDITNGRLELMSFYNKHIVSTVQCFFYGIGLQSFSEKLDMMYGYSVEVCHNGLQELWVAWGIVGVIIFISVLIRLFQTNKFSFKRILWNYTPLLLILLYVSSSQLIRSGTTMMAFVIAYIVFINPVQELKWKKV